MWSLHQNVFIFLFLANLLNLYVMIYTGFYLLSLCSFHSFLNAASLSQICMSRAIDQCVKHFLTSSTLLFKNTHHHFLVKAQTDPCWLADLYIHIFLFHYNLFPGWIMSPTQLGALTSASVAFDHWWKSKNHLNARTNYPLKGCRVSAGLHLPRAQSSCTYSYQLRAL